MNEEISCKLSKNHKIEAKTKASTVDDCIFFMFMLK